MFLMRKSSRRFLFVAFFICAFYFFYAYLVAEPSEYRNSQYKLNVIENAIQSEENQFECHMPKLPLNSPELMAFLKTEPSIQCDDVEPWVVCGHNKKKPWLCMIRNPIIDRIGLIVCDFVEIVRDEDDFSIKRATKVQSTKYFELTKSDFVSVKCWTNEHNERKYWNGLLIGIRKTNENDVKPKSQSVQLPFNVIIFGLDSLSRNAFIRKLPRTYKYMTDELQSDVLQSYNIVGDGTPQALIPLLTGFTELELPETRKRIKDSSFVNIYPFLFYDYANSGYVTAFNEDLPDYGTFSYRLNGFKQQPTTHYMRSFYLAFQSEMNRHKKLCIGDISRHQVMLDYTKNFMLAYRGKKPQFAFSFHGELSHDSINLVGVADDDIAEWLKYLKYSGLLKRTILVMMADHGNRFADVRNTLQGKLEERLPFFSFTFPDAFKKRYHKEYIEFRKNLNRLVTPFDIHETFLDILRVQKVDGLIENTNKSFSFKNDPKLSNITKKYNRALSLFKAIPKNRTCADAYIEPHWCSCLSLNFIDTNMDLVKRAANAIVERINEYTNVERSMCHALKLFNNTWAGTLQPRQNLLKFKQNRDLDGFLADLTSTTTKITNALYQLQVIVQPGHSIFEASLKYNLQTDRFSVNISDVSRINKYGNQARCIYDKNPDLRQFCYCR